MRQILICISIVIGIFLCGCRHFYYSVRNFSGEVISLKLNYSDEKSWELPLENSNTFLLDEFEHPLESIDIFDSNGKFLMRYNVPKSLSNKAVSFVFTFDREYVAPKEGKNVGNVYVVIPRGE